MQHGTTDLIHDHMIYDFSMCTQVCVGIINTYLRMLHLIVFNLLLPLFSNNELSLKNIEGVYFGVATYSFCV